MAKAKTNEVTDALNMALDLEVEGRKFYQRCAEETRDPKGKEMFKYLAGEEESHYEKLERLYRDEFDKEYSAYKKKKPDLGISGIFKRRVSGGEAGSKAGALDALNIALKAEENSIILYERLMDFAKSEKMRKLFAKVASEERNHFMIIKEAIDSVTRTGAYYDFKVVTS